MEKDDKKIISAMGTNENDEALFFPHLQKLMHPSTTQ